MRVFLSYIYYRLVKFYKNTFGIEDSDSFFIQSCYNWGLLVLLTSLCLYLLSIITLLLWQWRIKINVYILIVTMIPFALFHFLSESFIGDIKQKYQALEEKYQNEKLPWLKGLGVFLFVILSLVSYLLALHYCK